MRGRTFLNRTSSLTSAEPDTQADEGARDPRRAGQQSGVLGNIAQIDTPYLTETTCGLTYVVNRFQGWQHSGHITLVRGERSRLAISPPTRCSGFPGSRHGTLAL